MDLYPFVSFNATKAFNMAIVALPVGIAHTLVNHPGSLDLKNSYDYECYSNHLKRSTLAIIHQLFKRFYSAFWGRFSGTSNWTLLLSQPHPSFPHSEWLSIFWNRFIFSSPTKCKKYIYYFNCVWFPFSCWSISFQRIFIFMQVAI